MRAAGFSLMALIARDGLSDDGDSDLSAASMEPALSVAPVGTGGLTMAATAMR